MMGSPSYMAPEQMRSSKDVDGRTDIWALGVILFELIAGRPAFLADTVPALAIKIVTEPAPAIRSIRPDVPAGLETILFKCFEKDRAARYSNVAQLALALLPFAPTRAKASVERISGIIRAAGLSTSTLPPSPRTVGPTGTAGTVPPFGRTATGTTGRRAAVLGVGLAGAIVVAVISAAAMSVLHRSAHRESLQSASAGAPSVTPSQEPQHPASPPEADAANAIDPTPVVLTPATPPAPVALPQAIAAPKTLPPRPNPTLPLPSGARHPGPPTPPGTRCDPPYYFDSRGTRVFKTECI
jgi:serine/threonine-protein kinase